MISDLTAVIAAGHAGPVLRLIITARGMFFCTEMDMAQQWRRRIIERCPV